MCRRSLKNMSVSYDSPYSCIEASSLFKCGNINAPWTHATYKPETRNQAQASLSFPRVQIKTQGTLGLAGLDRLLEALRDTDTRLASLLKYRRDRILLVQATSPSPNLFAHPCGGYLYCLCCLFCRWVLLEAICGFEAGRKPSQ